VSHVIRIAHARPGPLFGYHRLLHDPLGGRSLSGNALWRSHSLRTGFSFLVRAEDAQAASGAAAQPISEFSEDRIQ